MSTPTNLRSKRGTNIGRLLSNHVPIGNIVKIETFLTIEDCDDEGPCSWEQYFIVTHRREFFVKVFTVIENVCSRRSETHICSGISDDPMDDKDLILLWEKSIDKPIVSSFPDQFPQAEPLQ